MEKHLFPVSLIFGYICILSTISCQPARPRLVIPTATQHFNRLREERNRVRNGPFDTQQTLSQPNDGPTDVLLQSAVGSSDPWSQATDRSSDPWSQSTGESSDPWSQSTGGSSDPWSQSTGDSSDPWSQSTGGSSGPWSQSASGASDPWSQSAGGQTNVDQNNPASQGSPDSRHHNNPINVPTASDPLDTTANALLSPSGAHVDMPNEHGNTNAFPVLHHGHQPIEGNTASVDFQTGLESPGISNAGSNGPVSPGISNSESTGPVSPGMNNAGLQSVMDFGPSNVNIAGGAFMGSRVHQDPSGPFLNQDAFINLGVQPNRGIPTDSITSILAESGNSVDNSGIQKSEFVSDGEITHVGAHIDMPQQHGNRLDVPVLHRPDSANAGTPLDQPLNTHAPVGGLSNTVPPGPSIGTSVHDGAHIDMPQQHGNRLDVPVLHRPDSTHSGTPLDQPLNTHAPVGGLSNTVPPGPSIGTSVHDGAHIDMPQQHGNRLDVPVLHRPDSTHSSTPLDQPLNSHVPVGGLSNIVPAGPSIGPSVHDGARIDMPQQHGHTLGVPVLHTPNSSGNTVVRATNIGGVSDKLPAGGQGELLGPTQHIRHSNIDNSRTNPLLESILNAGNPISENSPGNVPGSDIPPPDVLADMRRMDRLILARNGQGNSLGDTPNLPSITATGITGLPLGTRISPGNIMPPDVQADIFRERMSNIQIPGFPNTHAVNNVALQGDHSVTAVGSSKGRLHNNRNNKGVIPIDVQAEILRDRQINSGSIPSTVGIPPELRAEVTDIVQGGTNVFPGTIGSLPGSLTGPGLASPLPEAFPTTFGRWRGRGRRRGWRRGGRRRRWRNRGRGRWRGRNRGKGNNVDIIGGTSKGDAVSSDINSGTTGYQSRERNPSKDQQKGHNNRNTPSKDQHKGHNDRNTPSKDQHSGNNDRNTPSKDQHSGHNDKKTPNKDQGPANSGPAVVRVITNPGRGPGGLLGNLLRTAVNVFSGNNAPRIQSFGGGNLFGQPGVVRISTGGGNLANNFLGRLFMRG